MDDQTIVGAVSGEFVTETFEYDGGRQVTVQQSITRCHAHRARAEAVAAALHDPDRP
jgi:hypothetical protein